MKIWNDLKMAGDQWVPGHCFFKTEDGLMFFRDTDYQPRLCIPSNQRRLILKEAHE